MTTSRRGVLSGAVVLTAAGASGNIVFAGTPRKKTTMKSPDASNYIAHLGICRGIVYFAENGVDFRDIGNAPHFVYVTREDGTCLVHLHIDEMTDENVLWAELRPAGILRFKPTNSIGPRMSFEAQVKMLTSDMQIIHDGGWSFIAITFEVQSPAPQWTVTPQPTV